MRFASLGSGSEGNALVVEAGATRVMLDCGFSLRDTESRLARAGLDPGQISALCLTHEHDDHASGAFVFARRHRIPVWLTSGTLAGVRAATGGADAGVRTQAILAEQRFEIGDLEVLPYTVPHDAREPVQFVFSDGGARLGVLTDTGRSTAHIEAVLSGCAALVLEANHDRQMLEQGPYPPRLKSRIAGGFGHLDNAAAGALLCTLERRRLRHVVAAHLSQTNNTPAHAAAAFAAALGCGEDWITLAPQASGFEWREI
ncbi:MAG: MBL fold metallo-hydrolase [Burkholderiales bacterium]|nr:MBL fold metallo-hydrolase [Burkholderiales bacterium]